MGKTRKNIQTMTIPTQYYYPTMLVPYIPKKRTKKKHINDFNYTYGHHFNPNEMMKPPKTRIVFNKNDDIYQFTKNTLSLYNIDYNPSFVEFSMNNFKAKIKEYLNHYKNKNLYIDSVNSIRKSSELLELEKVLNEHELHLILEALDTMFEYSNFKNFKIKQDSSEVRDMHNFIMKDKNFNKLQGTLVGGGNIKKFDIINYVNGNKRKEIKERIINMVYVDFENEDTMGYIYDQGWPNDFEMNLNDKKRSIINDEIMDTCFDAFVQQKIFTHLGYTDKDENPYFRGEFQKNLKGCKDKKYYNPDFFEDKVPTWAFKRPGVDKPEAFEKKPDNEDFEPLDDKFEFTEGRSMINVDYLNFIINNKEKHNELKELIEVYHKLQIPDTRFARNKEKMMKEYLSSISMAIIMLGMLPPSFFGEDYDFNPFDVLSTVMCIFEGSTVCAVMSALPLFSPFLDMLSTFSIVRKILNKFGVTGAVGKRSQAAIKKAQQRKIAKQNAFMEKGVKLKADLSTMARNMENARGLQKVRLEKQFSKLKKANENYAKQSKKMAEKGIVDSMKRAKAQSKGAEKLIKQINSGRSVKSLSAAEKAKLQRYTELLNMQKNAPNLKLPKGVGVKNVDGQIKNLEGALKGSTDGAKILKNGKKAANDSIDFLKSAQNELRAVKNVTNPNAAVKEFGKYETEMAKITNKKEMLESGVNAQGVKLSQKQLDDLGAEVKKSMDALSPKHLVESRNYSEKQLKYLQTGTSPPVDKMARYEQSFKPSSDSSIAQIKKQQKQMIDSHFKTLERERKRAQAKLSFTDAATVSRDVKNFKAKTGVIAKQIKETEKQLKLQKSARNSTSYVSKKRGTRKRRQAGNEVSKLEKKLEKQQDELRKTMKEGLEEIGKKTEGMDPSTQKILDDATESIIGKRLQQSGIKNFTAKKKVLNAEGNFVDIERTFKFTDKGKTWTGTLKSSKADKAKVRRASRAKQLKASEESIQEARRQKKALEKIKTEQNSKLSEILGADSKILANLDDTAREALKKGDFTATIRILEDTTGMDPNKIYKVKALQAEFKAAEAQSKYAATVARKNFDKVITGQTKKRFYDFRTWGKEGRTKRLNNFKRAQGDLLEGLDDVVTPGLTRVKNKDVKYFKAQAEVAEQEAKLAALKAEEVSLHQKFLKQKQEELANLGTKSKIQEAANFKRTNTANNILAQEIAKLRRQKIVEGETLETLEKQRKYSISSKDKNVLEEVVSGKQKAFDDAKKNLQRAEKESRLAKRALKKGEKALKGKQKALNEATEELNKARKQFQGESQNLLDEFIEARTRLEKAGDGRTSLLKKHLGEAQTRLRADPSVTKEMRESMEVAFKNKKKLDAEVQSIIKENIQLQTARDAKNLSVKNLNRTFTKAKKELKRIESARDARLAKASNAAPTIAPKPATREVLEKQIAQAQKNLDLVIEKGRVQEASRGLETANQEYFRNEQIWKDLSKKYKNAKTQKVRDELGKEISIVQEKLINYGGASTKNRLLVSRPSDRFRFLQEKAQERIVARQKVKNLQKEINMDGLGLNLNQVKEFGNIEKNINAASLKVQIADKGAKNIYRTGLSTVKSFKKGRLRRTMEKEQVKLQKRFDAISEKHSKAQAELSKVEDQIQALTKQKEKLLPSNVQADTLTTKQKEKLLQGNVQADTLGNAINVLEKQKKLAKARIAQRQQEFLDAAQGNFKKSKRLRGEKMTLKKNVFKGIKGEKTYKKGLDKLTDSLKKQDKLNEEIRMLEKATPTPENLRRLELLETNLLLQTQRINQNMRRIKYSSKNYFQGMGKTAEKKLKTKAQKLTLEAEEIGKDLEKLEDQILTSLKKSPPDSTDDLVREFMKKKEQMTMSRLELSKEMAEQEAKRAKEYLQEEFSKMLKDKDISLESLKNIQGVPDELAKAVEKIKLLKDQQRKGLLLTGALPVAVAFDAAGTLGASTGALALGTGAVYLKKTRELNKAIDQAVDVLSNPRVLNTLSEGGVEIAPDLMKRAEVLKNANIKKEAAEALINKQRLRVGLVDGLEDSVGLEQKAKAAREAAGEAVEEAASASLAARKKQLMANLANREDQAATLIQRKWRARGKTSKQLNDEATAILNHGVAVRGERWSNTVRFQSDNLIDPGMLETVQRAERLDSAVDVTRASREAAKKADSTFVGRTDILDLDAARVAREAAEKKAADAERLLIQAREKALEEGSKIRLEALADEADFSRLKKQVEQAEQVAEQTRLSKTTAQSAKASESRKALEALDIEQANKLEKFNKLIENIKNADLSSLKLTGDDLVAFKNAREKISNINLKKIEDLTTQNINDVKEAVKSLKSTGSTSTWGTVGGQSKRLNRIDGLTINDFEKKLESLAAQRKKLDADLAAAVKQANTPNTELERLRKEFETAEQKWNESKKLLEADKERRLLAESEPQRLLEEAAEEKARITQLENKLAREAAEAAENLAAARAAENLAAAQRTAEAERAARAAENLAAAQRAAEAERAARAAENLAAAQRTAEAERAARAAENLAAAERAAAEKARLAEELAAAERAAETTVEQVRIADATTDAQRATRELELELEQEFLESQQIFKKKAAIESGEEAGKKVESIDKQIDALRGNPGTDTEILRLEADKRLLEFDIKKANQLKMTQADKTMDSALEAVESKLEILKLQEAVKPVVPPMERLQQFLDNLADAYLVKYNVEEEYQHIQDVEFDKQCADANNRLLENIWSKNGQDAFLKFGTMMGGSIGDMGGVFTALQAFQKQSRFLQSFDLSEEEKEKKIQELRHGKHKKGISDREKDRRINYGTAMAEESFLRKKGKKSKNNLRGEKEKLNLENAKLNARLESNKLSYEELDDVMDTHTEDHLEDERFNQNKMSEVDELIREDLGKQTYQLRSSQSDRVEKAMIKELRDKRRIKRRVDRKRLKEFEEEQESLEEGNEMKVLLPGESKTSTPGMRIEGATATQSENTSSGRFISTGKRDRKDNISNENNNSTTIGGGKKKEPEFILRNDVLNDSQLRKELDKFAVDYKGYMVEFNKPLEELMKRRSDYKIKQKLTLKENFLKIYRDTKSEAFQEVQDIKKLEFETFEQQNNYYTKQKKQLFKAISSTGGNAFMILNVQLGTFNKTKTLVEEIEKLELKMNKMIEDKEISEFIRNFDKILEKIGKKEVEIKKIKKDIQEFKAKDADLDKLLKELAILEKERKNYKADTNKKKTYTKMASKLRILAKELLESQEFVKLYDTFKKKKMSFDVFRNNKKGQFDSLKKMLIDEIKYIKNEYDIAKFFSLGLSGIKKLTLVEVLQSIYLDIFKVRKSFEVINEFYEEENPKINAEIKSGEEQINFYYRTREKIILKEDKGLFEKRYENRKKNLKLLRELQINLVNDHVDNLNIIDKCNDLLFYCDFNINNIKNINIIQETKTKILTDKNGLIDINELHEKQLDRSINLTYKELSDILDDILSYRKIINSSRIKLKKSITDKHIKKGKVTKVFLEEKKKGDTEKKKETHDQLKTVDKRLMDYEAINIDYMNFEKPIDLLIFYKILDSEINLEGKMEYTFNKLGCEMRDIKVDLILEDKLKSINTFINTHEIV